MNLVVNLGIYSIVDLYGVEEIKFTQRCLTFIRPHKVSLFEVNLALDIHFISFF